MINLLQHLRIAPKKLKQNALEKRFPDAYIHPDSYISKFVSIGTGSRINSPAYVQAHTDAPVVIGKYLAIAHNLRVRSRNHSTGYANIQDHLQKECHFQINDVFKGAITVGSSAWIADNVTILSGATVGEGAVIGACSVITKPIPPYAVAVGTPAKVIRYRFNKQIIEQFMTIQWWNWSLEKIKANKLFFETDFGINEKVDLHALITD